MYEDFVRLDLEIEVIRAVKLEMLQAYLKIEFDNALKNIDKSDIEANKALKQMRDRQMKEFIIQSILFGNQPFSEEIVFDQIMEKLPGHKFSDDQLDEYDEESNKIWKKQVVVTR
jgi:hypothetical protein